MSSPFLGEIRMFAGNFAPRGWAFCDGQLLAVSRNDALFSLLGTIYGGDGRTTFGLPDLRGRVPIHAGTGPGLSPRTLGYRSGAEDVQLTANEIPNHSHDIIASNNPASENSVNSNTFGNSPSAYTKPRSLKSLDTNILHPAGGNQTHTNVMPFQCIHFIIALFGVYPSRQ